MKRLYYEPYYIKDDEAGCSDHSNDFVHAATQSDDDFIVSDDEPVPNLEESSEESFVNNDFSTESLDESQKMNFLFDDESDGDNFYLYGSDIEGCQKSEIDKPQMENIQIDNPQIENQQIENSKIEIQQIENPQIENPQIKKLKSRRIIEKSDSESESFDIVSDSMFEIGNSQLIDAESSFIPVHTKNTELIENLKLVTKIGWVKRGPGPLWM